MTTVDMASALVREGRLGDAVNLMTRELQTATETYGAGTPQWASTQCDLGNVLLDADRRAQAIECFRQAAAVPPRDHESHQDQLTYLLNLGLALRLDGQLDEAETELRRGVVERLAFYGRDHAGYAFGLEPLADLLRRRGNLAEARPMVEEAVANLWSNGHEKVASALALRAVIVHAGGTGEPLFIRLDQLPDGLVEQVGRVVPQSLDKTDPASIPLVRALIAALTGRLGETHQATLNGWAALSNVARSLGDQATRVAALERVLAGYDRSGRSADAVNAALGLAIAQDDAGERKAGLKTYAAAAKRANRLGRPELHSQVLRNWGLALKEAGQPGPAEKRMTEALSEARRGADPEMVGRAAVALGLFLQHENRLSEARTIIEDGLAVLSPAHPDAIVGRSHLTAVLDGRTCGCGDTPAAIADAFRDFVTARIPADLLDRLDVTVADGDFDIAVALRREPAEGELEQLDTVLRTALTEFRRGLDRSS